MESSPSPWRTFAIFISSTFADMQSERDYLKNFIIPRLEEALTGKRIRIEVVDLRWGVDTDSVKEDEREATVLKVCMDEIHRCRPFFIGLLGDRYGWVPPEERLKTAMAGKTKILPEKGKSVTALEIELGVLASSAQLSRSVFYLRNPLPYDKMRPETAAKYCDQYDQKLSSEERKIRKDAFNKLKEAINAHFPANERVCKVKKYDALWDDASESVTGIKKWGEWVYEDILEECKNHAAETWDKVPANKDEQEEALLETFIEERTHISTHFTDKGEETIPSFCGRKELIDAMKRHLLSDDRSIQARVLTGESGSGKSAVFSMMVKVMKKEKQLVLAHSAGVSPTARSITEMLKSWVRQLGEIPETEKDKDEKSPGRTNMEAPNFGNIAGPQTQTEERLREQFSRLLTQTARRKKVIILIDALESFEPTPEARFMTWLPKPLPPGVWMLITAIEGAEKEAVGYHPELKAVSIDHFSEQESREMLLSLCRQQHKTLSPTVVTAILSRKRANKQPAASSPLWLSLAVNILAAMDADDFARMGGMKGSGSEQITAYMLQLTEAFPAEPGALFYHLAEKAAGLFGKEFTLAIFNLIACSRSGLRESDLEKLVTRLTGESWDPLRFATLRRWFRKHLTELGEDHQWNFTHSILRTSLIEKTDSQKLEHFHSNIAEHLLSLSASDPLRNSETMYHLMQLKDKKKAGLYYASGLTEEGLTNATAILADMVMQSQAGLEAVASLPFIEFHSMEEFSELSMRLIFQLNTQLKTSGNLSQRLYLLKQTESASRKKFAGKIPKKFTGTFSLFLNEKLGSLYEEHGQLDEALAHYEKLLADAESFEHEFQSGYPEEASHVMVISSERMGSINLKLGRLAEADQCYKKMEGLCKKLLKQFPKDSSFLKFMAVALLKSGELKLLTGCSDIAYQDFRQANNLLHDSCMNNPKDEQAAIHYAISFERTGTACIELGNPSEALQCFTVETKLVNDLLIRNPGNAIIKMGLATSNMKQGEANMALRNPDQAKTNFETYKNIIQELLGQDPENEQLKSMLANSHDNLAGMYAVMNQLQKAIEHAVLFNNLMREIIDADPGNVMLLNGWMKSFQMLSELYRNAGLHTNAFQVVTEALTMGRKMMEASPKNLMLKNSIAVMYSELGDFYLSTGDSRLALVNYEQFHLLEKEIYAVQPEDEITLTNMSASSDRLARVFLERGATEDAIKYFEIDAFFRQKIFERRNNDTTLCGDLGDSFGQLGDMYRGANNLVKAIDCFLKGAAYYTRALEMNPNDSASKRSLAICFYRTALSYQSMNNLEAALKYFRLHYFHYEEYYRNNPSDATIKLGFKGSNEKMGAILEALGEIKEALVYYQRFNQLCAELYQQNPHGNNFAQQLNYSKEKLIQLQQMLTHGKSNTGSPSKNILHERKEPIEELRATVPPPSNAAPLTGNMTTFEQAEKAFKEASWDNAFRLYLKCIQDDSEDKLDVNYLRYQMALCRIGGMTSPDDHESVNNINVLIGLLRDKGETDKARAILDHFEKHQELLKRKGNDPGKKKPWWKR